MTRSEPQSVERPIAACVLALLAGLSLLASSGMMYGGIHGAWGGSKSRFARRAGATSTAVRVSADAARA